MGDELEQVLTVDGGVTEPFPHAEPVRVQATAADFHHRAVPALRRERAGAELPRHRRRVVKHVVEAARHDVQAGAGRAWIG